MTHCSGSTCGWQCALGWGGGEPANPHFTDSEKRPRECRTQAHRRPGQAPSHRRLSRVTLLPQSKFLTRTEPTRDPRGRIPEALVPGEKQEQEDRGRERDNERQRPSRTGTEGWWRRGWGPPRRHQSGQRDRQSSGQRRGEDGSVLGQERGGLSQPTVGPTRDGRAAETRVLLSPGSRRRSALPSLLLPQGWAPQPLRTAHLQCCAPSGQALPSLSSASQVGGTSGPAPALSPC